MHDTASTDVVIYQAEDGSTQLEVQLRDENVWLTRHQMAALFGRDVKTIGKHITNARREELSGRATVAKFATVLRALPSTTGVSHSWGQWLRFSAGQMRSLSAVWRRCCRSICRACNCCSSTMTPTSPLPKVQPRGGSSPMTKLAESSMSWLFVTFLSRNGLLEQSGITNSALAAITLMVAMSEPREKELMVTLVIILLAS